MGLENIFHLSLSFPEKKKSPDFLRGAPCGSECFMEPSGWMTYDGFVEWLKFFINRVGCTPERKALLILDGHITHVKSIAAVELARSNGVVMIRLPPHCTHRMQPMDVTVMGPLQTGFAKKCAEWMRSHPGDQITIYYVAELFGKSYEEVTKTNNLSSGFEKCGLWPVKTDVFDGQFTTAHQQSFTVNEDLDQVEPIATSTPLNQSSNSSIGPADIIPVPVITYNSDKGKKKKKKREDKSEEAAILTSSPHLRKLKLEEENRLLKEQVKQLKRDLRQSKKGENPGPSSEKGISQDEPIKIVNISSSKQKKTKKKKKSKMTIKKELFANDDNLPRPESASTILGDVQQLQPGQFVLVKFDVRDVVCFYAGHARTELDQATQTVEVKFLRRVAAAKNPSETKLRFSYPNEEDIKDVPAKDIVLLLQLPEMKGQSSKRLASKLVFEDARLKDFSPIY